MLRDRLLDGRKRMAAYRTIFGESPTAIRTARDELDAVRFLVAVEHYDRALALLPEGVPVDNDLALLLRLEPARIAPLVALVRHTGRRARPRRKRERADVVTTLRDLYVLSLEGHVVTSENLRDALGEWL